MLRSIFTRIVGLLLLTLPVLTIATGLHAAGVQTDAAQSQAEHAVIGYINAYRYRDFTTAGRFDAIISAAINERLKAQPHGLNRLAEAGKPELEAMQHAEQEKLAGTANSPFSRQAPKSTSVLPLYKALYPGITFRFITPPIQNSTGRDTPLDTELTYADSARAPRHHGKRVRSARIRIMVRHGKETPEYRVLGYYPSGKGMTFFVK